MSASSERRLELSMAAHSSAAMPSNSAMPSSSARADRRQALKCLAGVLLALRLPQSRAAQAARDDEAAFGAGSLEGVLRALGANPAPSEQISLMVPDLVENGAVVPVEISSRLSGSQEIFVISEANPFPLVARFSIPEGTDAFVSTRIKVARSCNLYALVASDGEFYSAVKATQVVTGGCGG